MQSTHATFLAALAVTCCILYSPAPAEGKSPSLEVKYSIAGFEKLNWKITPPEHATSLEMNNGEWRLANSGSSTLLVVAPYNERDFGIACEIAFPKRLPQGERVSVLFNYQYYETLGKSSYAEIRLYPDGKFEFGHSDNGYMLVQQTGRFPLFRGRNRDVKLYFAKLRNEIHFVINNKRSTIKVGIEAKQGGFGFGLPPGSSAVLSNFKFTVYREVDVPFEGVDVIGLFAPKQR